MPQNNQSSSLLTLKPQKWCDYVANVLQKRPKCIFFLFLGLSFFFYIPTIQAGFVTDVTSGIERIQGQPFQNILYSFGFPALNQISILGFYVLYKVFGINGLPWYIVFCGLHALNAFLSFTIFKILFQHFNIKNGLEISLFGSLLFLLSPYQTEVLVWRACLNYLLVTAFILLSLFHLLRHLQSNSIYSEIFRTESASRTPSSGSTQPFRIKSNKLRHLYYLHGFFILALFTFELSLILPLLAICFYMSWLYMANQFQQFRSYLLKITLPHISLISGYFLLNKLMIGKWIGHYGAATHLQFSLEMMSSNLLKYVVKYFFFVRSYPHAYKAAIFNFCDEYGWLILCFLAISSLIFLLYKKNKPPFNGNKKTAFIILLSTTFIITLLPVLNLFFYWLQHIENDRYGYLPSVFGLMLISYLIFQLTKYVRYGILIIYLAISVFLLVQTNQYWKDSITVFYGLLADYRWYDAENVVILNVPDNYNGAYLFRIIGRTSGFQDALTNIHKKKVKGKIWEVVQYNMVEPTDGVNAAKTNPNQLKVTFNQWGNWFWRNGVGVGTTHQRSIYTAHFKGQYYLLDLKNPSTNTVYIYQDGKEWKEL